MQALGKPAFLVFDLSLERHLGSSQEIGRGSLVIFYGCIA